MQKVNEAIDATEKELIAGRLKFPRNTEKIFGSEKEMRKAYEEAVSIAKEYYARKAYQYLDGNAGNFLSNRWMFPVGKPVSNSNNIRDIIDRTAREIAHGGSEDGYGMKRDIEKFKKGEKWKYNK